MQNLVARIWIDYDSVKSVDGRKFLPCEVLRGILSVMRQEADIGSANVYRALGYKNLGSSIPQSEVFEVQRLGGTLIPVPSYPDPGSISGLKSLVDPTLTADMAFELGSSIRPFDIVALATSNKHFIPLVRMARRSGKDVWLFYGEKPAAALIEDATMNRGDRAVDLAELLRTDAY